MNPTEEHTYTVAQPVQLAKPEPNGVRGKRLTSERIALDDDGVNSVDQDTVPDKKRLPTNQHLPYTTEWFLLPKWSRRTRI